MGDNADQKSAMAFVRMNSFAQFITVDGTVPRARVMQTARIEDDFTLWFATYLKSDKVEHIQTNPNVCAAYMIPGIDLIIQGQAEVVTERSKLDELWDPAWQRFFPGGNTDPNYSLIRVSPSRVDFRDAYTHGFEPRQIT